MDERHRSDSRDALQSRGDSDTDNIDLTPLHESGMTQTFENASRERAGSGPLQVESEADVILIAHPEGQRLGSRFRLSPGTTLEIGRSAAVGVSLPEVMSISRKHARLRYIGPAVTIEDLGSTNGTYINGQPIHGRAVLRSGDRFQTAAVHFKFLHEQDVESAYHLAIYELVAKDGLTEIFNKRKFEEELQQVLARVGGDEFVILAPETGSEGAESLASKLRDKIAGYEHRYGDIRINVGCPVGVAELSREMTPPQDLYQAADEALL